MVFDEAGTYTIEYTATDECGNTTNAERTVIVEAPPTYRTVLYTDGTFIINESSRDEAANVALHGQPTNVYDTFDPDGDTDVDKYVFANASARPWNNEVSTVIGVIIGSEIQPTDTKYWFNGMNNMTSFNGANLDTSHVTSMSNMFNGCSSLESLDVSNFNTALSSNMVSMFSACSSLDELDLSNFDTSAVRYASNMFSGDNHLKTIYASNLFVTSQLSSANSKNMFNGCSSLVGGSGTTFSYSNPSDKTYAHIDGGVSDPGYFTAKN